MNGTTILRAAAVLLVAAAFVATASAQAGGLDRLPDLSPGRTVPSPTSVPAADGAFDVDPAAADEATSPDDHGTANRFAAEAAAKRAAEERRPSTAERRFSAVAVFAIAALLGLAALARTFLRARKN